MILIIVLLFNISLFGMQFAETESEEAESVGELSQQLIYRHFDWINKLSYRDNDLEIKTERIGHCYQAQLVEQNGQSYNWKSREHYESAQFVHKVLDFFITNNFELFKFYEQPDSFAMEFRYRVCPTGPEFFEVITLSKIKSQISYDTYAMGTGNQYCKLPSYAPEPADTKIASEFMLRILRKIKNGKVHKK